MDEKLATALAKRLAAYSASAGVALAVAPKAGAQVVYHDFDPDLVIESTNPPSTLDLDLDDDGVPDLQLFACGPDWYDCTYRERRTRPRAGRLYYFQYQFELRVPEGGSAMNGALGYNDVSFGDVCASRLGTGDVVGPAAPGQLFAPSAVAAYRDYSYGPYCPFVGREGYAGFRFVAGDGALHYGWIRLSATSNASTGTAYEYAYEATPDTPIAAGAVSDVVLTGSVNQTTFPPSGGTLRYTFTAENITNQLLPLDLWVHYRRGTGAGRTQLLGSGTLPPRARVTRTVSLPVPAGAPATDYDVRFKVGNFSSGAFLTFQRFTVTKEAAVGLAGDGLALFAVPSAEGDLFAGVEATALAGTHALSAPSPNPTTGRAEVALSVAEAQAVRVEVFDALGRRVALLHDGVLAAGAEHRLAFDGSALPAGVYVVRVVAETFVDVRALTLAR